ncbi:restriction endonuclease subunit S [Comamonas sp. E6]|uniref:restriction endonuclease subunit S n=1 Tax=Comamonas sp. E6 TaxID=364029 RepID=UPI000635D1A3|nr:restriction endonuclease subunit S [Comamonas sp. E6]GAO73552.1 putative type I restriction-modification system specificity subunit [Comamonas sp. E6]
MLLSNMELLATAPGGVAKLRELILTLAVQGKLVPQDPADEPASVLLQKIRAEKDRLIAAKILKREKNEPALSDEELPFELPASWSWVALGEVIDIVRGITFPANQKTKEAAAGRIACLRTSNVQQTIEWDDLLFVDRSFMGREDQLIQHHDIVMSMANSRELVGKVALIEHIPHAEATFGGFLGVLRPRKIDPRYAMAVLRTPYARSLLIDSSSQTTNIANISLTKLRPLQFPLPPATEQLRIVARVEELMRLCDALEAKGQLEAMQHAQLVSTLLGTLTASATPEELADNWQRVAQHYDLLLDRPEAIDALEQTLLQLAVRGVLVPQDPADEPASVLLQKIRAEKDRLIAAGQIKRGKPLAPITDEEKPFALPVGWEWARFGQIASIASNLVSPALHLNKRQVAPDCIEKGTGRLLQKRTVAQAEIVSPNHFFKPGQILYSKIRPSLSKAVLVDFEGLCSADMYPIESMLNSDFLLMYILSRPFLNQVSIAENRVKMPKLNQEALVAFTVSLPPLAEQSRIVARVTELRRLCVDLRQRLAERQSVQARLAEALVQAAA